MATKYIFVTGGVVSSLGKGLAAASIGRLLEARGFKVTLQKFDPYLNVDPGTMSPFQHGEVFVTDDGAETDLDLGHYERFVSTTTTHDHNFTSGKIYESVIQKERRGDYLGGTVQVIPHVTDEIKAAIHRAAEGVDILICEVGGTVGDIESLPFLEAIRQMRADVGRDNFGVTFDPANIMACGGDYGPDAVGRLAPHLFNVFFQNVRLDPGSPIIFPSRLNGAVGVRYVALDDPGGVDVLPIIETLRAVGYDGWFTVHQPLRDGQSVDDAMEEAAGFFRPLIV